MIVGSHKTIQIYSLLNFYMVMLFWKKNCEGYQRFKMIFQFFLKPLHIYIKQNAFCFSGQKFSFRYIFGWKPPIIRATVHHLLTNGTSLGREKVEICENAKRGFAFQIKISLMKVENFSLEWDSSFSEVPVDAYHLTITDKLHELLLPLAYILICRISLSWYLAQAT